jgi:hypothetical protein
VTAARAIVAVVAVAVLAWLAVMERDQRLVASGIAAAGRGDHRAAERAFERARFLNPDATPDVGLAFVAQASGRPGDAQAQLEAVLRREPDNLSAWGQLRNLARGRDPQVEQRAEAAIRRLDPVNAAPTGPAAPR